MPALCFFRDRVRQKHCFGCWIKKTTNPSCNLESFENWVVAGFTRLFCTIQGGMFEIDQYKSMTAKDFSDADEIFDRVGLPKEIMVEMSQEEYKETCAL